MAESNAPKTEEVKSPYKEKDNKVENISKNVIHLASGKVEPGKTGLATPAECQTLHKYIKLVK